MNAIQILSGFGGATEIVAWITVLIIAMIIGLLFTKIDRQKDKAGRVDVIRPPKVYIWTGFVCTLFWLAFLLLFLLLGAFDASGTGYFAFFVFVLFLLFSSSLMFLYANWRVELLDDTFLYRTAFGNECVFRYDTVKITKQTPFYIHISADGKKLYAATHALGIERLKRKINPSYYTE